VLGVGLGVNAAARAETALDAPLAMWDPITDFEVFLRRLARVKMATSMGFEDYGGVYDGRSLAEVVADDLIEDEYERDGSFDARGFTVGRALRDSMARNPLLDLTTSSSRALFDAGEPGVATATARWLDDRLSE
jgi:hypothetical protein